MRKLNESPLAHCYASVLHNPETNKMRQRVSAYGIGTGNDKALADAAKLRDRKSTRLNSSHGYISYAVFCLKKKNNKQKNIYIRLHQ